MTRRRFHRRVYLGILRSQKLICACGCGVKMTTKEGYQFDHPVAIALFGPDTAEDIRALRTPCHKEKSALDIRMIRKADRQRKAWLGTEKRRGRQIPSRPLGPGRGFDTRLRKRMSGRVEVRT